MSDNFKLNLPELNRIMKSSAMEAHLATTGQAVAKSAGVGYGVRVHQASFVAIANVYPTSQESAKKNAEDHTLLKALSSVGLKM